jgi:co-chaperonin GroES (HSP10)
VVTVGSTEYARRKSNRGYVEVLRKHYSEEHRHKWSSEVKGGENVLYGARNVTEWKNEASSGNAKSM